MIEQSLDGTWRLREAGSGEWLDGHVPGGVHLDLLAAGRISDPFIGDEELRVAWVAERDWEYGREFLVDAGVAAQEHVELVFDGLDTLATMALNGEEIGRADNMFRSRRWDVTDRLRAGNNELSVVFESAVRIGAQLQAARFLDSANDQLPGAPHLRKSPSHFGWDWGPKLPNIGFWQGVRLEGWSTARFDDVSVRQRVDGSASGVGGVGAGVGAGVGGRAASARVMAGIRIERSATGGTAALRACVRLTHPNGRVETLWSGLPAGNAGTELEIDVADPELWWPNGLGRQPLYRVEVELLDGVRVLDSRSFEVGLRTIELRRDRDEWGESFQFVVNGVRLFAKGSNWIPADSFPARATPERVAGSLGAAAAANHNMVRVWGGGYYETEAFYDACDRLGILVWQDFMFACSVYPLDEAEFVVNLREEVREQVRRLRHRACLALWCGNNELEVGWADWGWDRPETAGLKAAWRRFFVDDLPAWIAADDPDTTYWFGSPSSGRPLGEKPSDRTGDYHEWSVWHALKPFESYTEQHYRFVSEFGFESLPAMATIAEFAPNPADWNLGSPVLDHHQRCPSGNARILYYLAGQFRMPRDFQGLVYLSQVLQAEAMRVGIEHWRRERDRCGGALYWQLNDCWPVSSWSSIDYFGRWKALHYASRRFYDPILLSVRLAKAAAAAEATAGAEDGSGAAVADGGSGAAVAAEAPTGFEAAIWLTNDTAESWSGRLRWSWERLDGTVVSEGAARVSVRPTASAEVAVLAVPADLPERRSTVLVAEFFIGEGRRSLVVAPLVPDKHMDLRRPVIEWSIEAESTPRASGAWSGLGAAGDVRTAAGAWAGVGARARATLRLRSDTLARWLEIKLGAADVVFDDNYFDLPAGREVVIGFELPEGWDLDRARQSLRLRSVADTYLEPVGA